MNGGLLSRQGGAAVIGALVAGAIEGSVLFAGVGGILAQDNAALYYDSATNRLGVGTNAPSEALHVVGNAHVTGAIDSTSATLVAAGNLAYLEAADGQSAGVSPANRGRLIYTTVGQKWQVSGNGVAYQDVVVGTGSGMAIGNTIANSPTVGSVLFVGTAGVLQQDNAKLFYDDTNDRLGIGNAAPTTALDVTGTTRTTNATITAMTLGSVLFAGASGAVTQDNANFFWDDTGNALSMGSGSAAGVSAANKGRLIYNESTQKWQLSANGAAYFDIGTLGAALTTGSVVFANSSGQLAQDNAKLFWDDTNDRLGIGNAAPTTALDVTGTTRTTNATITAMTLGSILFAGASGAVTQDNANLFFDDTNNRLGIGTTAPGLPLHVSNANTTQAVMRVRSSDVTNTGYAAIEFDPVDAVARPKSMLGFANSAVARTHLQGKNFWYCTDASANNTDIHFATSTGNTHVFSVQASGVGISMSTGASGTASAANFGKLIYHNGIGKFQISANGGSYASILTQAVSIGLLTTGSIVFANSTGDLIQDNANLFFDDTNNVLGVGTATVSTTHRLNIKTSGTAAHESIKLQAGATNNYADMVWFNSVNAQTGGIGYGGSALGNTLADRNFFYSPGTFDWVMSDATTNWFRWYATTNSVGFELANGSSGTVSAANTGKLRYNTTGQKSQLSFNGAAYFDVATYAAALTTGSVLFANGSNQLLQDNANFFWDDTNNRLGIGNAAPATTLHVTGTTRTTVGLTLDFLTLGSIPFTAASGVISQDNANLFWDNANKRLGVAMNTPAQALDVTGSINMTVSLFRGGTKVVGARGAAVADAAGGATIDAEARTAINALLAELRAATGHGLIA